MQTADSHIRAVIASVLLLTALQPARAEFFRVYGWETPGRGWMEPSLWNTYVAKSDIPYPHFEDSLRREELWSHSLEMAHGYTDSVSAALYADFQDPTGHALEFIRARFSIHYSLFSRYQRVFDTALYAEYYLPRAAYSQSEELETRLILEKDLEDFRVRLNPIISKAVSGEQVNDGVNFGFAGGVYWRRHFRVQPGLEYYNDLGELQDLPPADEQQHLLFVTADLRFARTAVWHLGLGWGMTDAADDMVFKSILSYEFRTLRPADQSW